LASAVLLDCSVPISVHLLQLLLQPDARLLLVILGLRLRVAMGEKFDPPFRISLLLQTMGFGGDCLYASVLSCAS